MPISINITKDSRKIFFCKYCRCHDKEYKVTGRFQRIYPKPPPDYVGENTKSIAESNQLWKQMIRHWIWRLQRAATTTNFGGAPDCSDSRGRVTSAEETR